MRILCWNVRGLGGKGRRRQLKEMVTNHRVDVICLQETMNEHFTIVELRGLVSGQSFS
jgi:exonuclease III